MIEVLVTPQHVEGLEIYIDARLAKGEATKHPQINRFLRSLAVDVLKEEGLAEAAVASLSSLNLSPVNLSDKNITHLLELMGYVYEKRHPHHDQDPDPINGGATKSAEGAVLSRRSHCQG
jgi:hypothetical protein